ncbi:hypothetical protein ACFQFQ_07350 [Sulfitobacter porphyrae]|uniref:Peptidase C39-like domain-containing protein n=1 Tax=Sulfitobacter porphyrae TaxID=1246864 RepID=A0ABW2B1E2_9RHOB
MAYTYYWADGHVSEQPYNQYTVNGCAIGCGSLAWTILFLWGDRQAYSGNSYWAPRWGLYRQDGGTGANVISPTSQTAGVNNVIEEIADDVGTFCIFGQGATYPWEMSDASAYFVGRTGTSLTTHYNALGISEGGCANMRAIRSATGTRGGDRHRLAQPLSGGLWLCLAETGGAQVFHLLLERNRL